MGPNRLLTNQIPRSAQRYTDYILKFLKLFWVLKLHCKSVLTVKWDSTKMVIYSAMCIFSDEHIQQHCSDKGIHAWVKEMLVDIHTHEVREIFMAVWKWSGCLIIYPVVSMQIQTTAQSQAPLSEILGQSLFRPRLPANAHGSQISPWHWKLVLWGAVDFNS